MGFAERYRQALRLKSPDVEEWVDRRWHRPLAAAATALILDLPVKPNHVTWMSLWAGTASSVVYGLTAFGERLEGSVGYPLAAFLLFVSVVLDCMDGQLARAKGGGTRMGRILDGAVDTLVLLPFYVLMGLHVWSLHGWGWFVVCVLGGLSTWSHTMVYDRLKGMYLAGTLEDPRSSDAEEDMEEVRAEWEVIKREGSLMDRVLFGLYVHAQLRVTEMVSGKEQGTALRERNSQEEIAAYRAAHRGTMRLVSWLGLGTHMILIYGSVALMAWTPWATVAVNVIFVVVGNAMMVASRMGARTFDQPVVVDA